MKNKKVLLIAAAAVLAAGVATAGVASFAWYSAVAEARTDVSTAAMTASVHGSSSTIDAITLYAKFTVSSTSTPKLTTSDGYCYALDNNNKIRKAEDGLLTTRYGTATVAFEGWYSDAAGTQQASDADIYQIVSGSLTLDVKGESRTRMGLTAPTTDAEFAGAFGSLGAAVQVTVTITESSGHTAAPTVALSNNGVVYFSIAGESPDQTKAQMDNRLGNTATPDVLSTFTQTLSVAKHA